MITEPDADRIAIASIRRSDDPRSLTRQNDVRSNIAIMFNCIYELGCDTAIETIADIEAIFF
jgi:hypothetical protein